MTACELPQARLSARVRAMATPGLVLFASANMANAANLAFNMVFARLLGPAMYADLAMLLSLKLSALCVLSAIQMSHARRVATEDRGPVTDAETASGARKALLPAFLIMLVVMSAAEAIAAVFSISQPSTFVLIALIVPALVPLSLYRGLAQGRIDLPRIVWSIQMEWMVRLFGGLALYLAGAGLTGIVLAMTLSVYAASFFAARPQTALENWKGGKPATSLPTGLYIAAVPFLVLQAAQVVILDGDIFLAKAMLPAETAGYAAALALVQRIFFFAFLSFSGLLLPVIARATAQDDAAGARRALARMLATLMALAAFPLACLIALPGLFITLFLGADYLTAAPHVWAASLTALLFTVSHLLATFELARGKIGAVIVLACAAGVQTTLVWAGLALNEGGLETLIFGKLAVQAALTLGLGAWVLASPLLKRA